MPDTRPIGVLDSGVGGLSVLGEIVKTLPEESIIYFADSKNCPYGTKPLAQLRAVTNRVVEFLLKKECKLVVVACNSITATLIEELRAKYPLPFVGIEPATLLAARATKNGKIGVLATQTTAKSPLFRETKGRVNPKIAVEVVVGQGLVELVEKGQLVGKETEGVVRKNLAILQKKGVDQVVLGCTHYPFLLETMQKVAPELAFVEPAAAVARQVKSRLRQANLENNAKNKVFYQIYYSTKTAGLEILLDKIQLKKAYSLQKREI